MNVAARAKYRLLAAMLSRLTKPVVLVIGGRVWGEGMSPILEVPGLHLIETDIACGPRTSLLCDAHLLPFESSSVDCVIIQAVLEHVFDPWKCVEEIHRVLKHEGLVYAETPFMQQVHEGCYDFTRFTHLGHRRLFRHFVEIDSGPSAGPGTALAWSWRYFLRSLSHHRILSGALERFARLSAWPLIQCDRFLIHRSDAFDAGSAYYFLGKRSEHVLSDSELVRQYRGRQNPPSSRT